MSGLVSSKGLTSANQASVSNEAYGADWNGDLAGASKNALYDKIETIAGGGGGDVTTAQLQAVQNNVLLNAMRQLIDNGGALYNMQDQFVDTFTDQAGIDTGTSTMIYDATSDCYAPGSANVFTGDFLFQAKLPADVSNGGTNFTDETGAHTLTANGTVSWSDALGATGDPWGGNRLSALFVPENDYIDAPDSADWNLAGNDFEITSWIYPTTTTDEEIVGQRDQTDANVADSGWTMRVSSGNLQFVYSTNGTATTALTFGAISTNSWQHIVVSRVGNTIRAFVDGTQSGTDKDVTGITINDSAIRLRIGTRRSGNSYFGGFNGYIGEVSINNGVGVTTSSVPTQPLSAAVTATTNLTSINQTADSEPTVARSVLKVENISGTVTLNTDIIVEFSKDGGTTWDAGTLRDQGLYATGLSILDTDAATLTSTGTNMRIRVRSANSKNFRIHDWAMQWA